MSKHVKVAVTGAAGQIGYALVFRLASGDVFGKDTTVDLHLIEIKPALPALHGLVMELQDCAFSTLGNVVITADPDVGFADVDYALLVGAMPRKQGMERADLLEKNAAIFSRQGQAINDHAADNIKVLVVGNPCNTNALIAMKNAPRIADTQFFAMTMLDENRARAQLALKAGVAVKDVTGMHIWGNHSATQYPDYFNANINGSPATDVISDDTWLQTDFISTVQKRGAAIIEARGASSAASAANAIIDSVKNIHGDSPAGHHYSLCRVSHGDYGVDEGLIYSFPCYTKNGHVEVLQGVEHNDFAQEKLQATLDELRKERDIVAELGLLG